MSEQKIDPQSSADCLTMSLEDKLYRTRYEVDQSFSHIRIVQEVCRRCEHKTCLFICPAKVYTQPSNDPDQITANYENCLECGTCSVACTNEGIEWSFPNGGRGVKFRFG